MTNRRWVGWLLVGISWMYQPSQGWTQGENDRKIRRSHLLEGLPPPPVNPETVESLVKRRHDKQHQDVAKMLIENGISIEQFEKMKQFLREHPDEFRQLLERMNLQGLDPNTLSAKFRSLDTNEVKKYMDDQKEAPKNPGTPDPGGTNPAAPPQPEQSASPGAAPAAPAPPGEPAAPNQEPEPEPGGSEIDNEQLNSPFARQMLKLAERLEKLDPSLARSHALREAMKKLNRTWNADERWEKLAKGTTGLNEKWTRWSQEAHLDRWLPKQGLSWPNRLTPRTFRPSGTRLRPPANLAGGSGLSGPNETTWQILLAVAGVVLGGLVLWKLLSRAQRAATRSHAAWTLGPWPVDPAGVQTREELIRAFEYLSLLCLGPAAQHWNHRMIADQLSSQGSGVRSQESGVRSQESAVRSQESGIRDGRSENQASELSSTEDSVRPRNPRPERRRAAEHLARLYEQARYAPLGDPLPTTSIAAARRDLCLLARGDAA
jgi:hypothetical protein